MIEKTMAMTVIVFFCSYRKWQQRKSFRGECEAFSELSLPGGDFFIGVWVLFGMFPAMAGMGITFLSGCAEFDKFRTSFMLY